MRLFEMGSTMMQAGSAMTRAFEIAEKAVTALETIADALTAPRPCEQCDEGGRLRCPTHGISTPRAWTDHPLVAAHIALDCDVIKDGSATAFCNTHNTGIELDS